MSARFPRRAMDGGFLSRRSPTLRPFVRNLSSVQLSGGIGGGKSEQGRQGRRTLHLSDSFSSFLQNYQATLEIDKLSGKDRLDWHLAM